METGSGLQRRRGGGRAQRTGAGRAGGVAGGELDCGSGGGGSGVYRPGAERGWKVAPSPLSKERAFIEAYSLKNCKSFLFIVDFSSQFLF